MTTELWWAIAAVVAIYAFVRWGLPALGWRRDCCGGSCAPKTLPKDAPVGDKVDDRWSKTQPITDTTVQMPPDDR